MPPAPPGRMLSDMTLTSYSAAVAVGARVRNSLAIGAVAAQALFIAAWLAFGAAEGDGYSPARHDISDLGALTANHATPFRLCLGLAGAVTIAFALGALRPALAVSGRGTPVGAWLVALSLPGLDNFTDAFFRLDCRAVDAGCSSSAAMDSWHGTAHIVFFVVAALATVAAPFALASRMRVVDGWRDFAGRTQVFGLVAIVLLGAAAATSGTDVQGLGQRVAATIIPLGIVPLAMRVVRSAAYEPGS
jgi:hypothetical membrane protein